MLFPGTRPPPRTRGAWGHPPTARIPQLGSAFSHSFAVGVPSHGGPGPKPCHLPRLPVRRLSQWAKTAPTLRNAAQMRNHSSGRRQAAGEPHFGEGGRGGQLPRAHGRLGFGSVVPVDWRGESSARESERSEFQRPRLSPGPWDPGYTLTRREPRVPHPGQTVVRTPSELLLGLRARSQDPRELQTQRIPAGRSVSLRKPPLMPAWGKLR